MHLVGLKIAGFKSFVDPVDVPIEEGLTGIVGPNGCGKSNLLEALRWAMGATSARAMRGGEMDDLIFSGTELRPAREIAEVILLLDNSDRSAPAEFNEDNLIEVRRSLRRGVGSSYRINGRTVRAKDVQLLFADASTGANSPALVRQGQISELIGAKPQNRRRILEEAAGIGGLAARRHEAELKLKAAEENLARLAEIMAEVERQANSLKRQASKARKYKALSEEITALEARLGAARWRGAVVETKEAREALEEAKLEEQKTVSASARASTVEIEAREQIEPLRTAESDAAGRLGAMKVQLARLEADRDTARETLARLERDIQRWIEDQARESVQRDDANVRADRANAQLDDLPPEDLDAQQEREDELSAAVDTAMTELQTFEQEADERRSTLAEAEAKAKAAEAALAREEDRYRRFSTDLDKAQKELVGLGDASTLERALADARKRHTDAEAKAQAAISSLATASKAVDDARAAEARLTPPLLAAERRVGELEAELKGLDRLLRKVDASAPPVLEGIRAPGLERAIAAALSEDLDAPTDRQAPAHWSGHAGDVSAPLPQGAQPLSDIVEAPAELRARLTQCGLVDRSRGLELISQLTPGQRLVSREGDLWRWDGFVRRNDAPLPAAERLEQRARRAQIEGELGSARAARDLAHDNRARASKALTDAEVTLMASRRDGPELTKLARAAHETAIRAEQDVERLSLRGAALKETVQRLSVERDHALEQVNAAKVALAAMPSDRDRGVLAELADKIRAMRETERTSAAALDAFLRETERAAQLRISLTKDRDEWLARAAEAEGRLGAIEHDLATSRQQHAETKDQPQALQTKLDQLADAVTEAEAARARAADTLAEADAALRSAELSSRVAREESSTAREGLVRAEGRLEAAVRREAEIAEQVRAAFDQDLDELEGRVTAVLTASRAARKEHGDKDLPEEEAVADAHVLDTRLAQLRRERDQLGAVNMEADEQLTEISGRMGMQVEEREDLAAAIGRLREGIDALNHDGRQRLLDAFTQVNSHFSSLFTALFGGGHAELRLTESDDPLSAGLEIYASPPGKRLGQLSLMSGGEQALTATALIFAVFLSRPAPICVLDEVDAPLDDANVDRFCRLLDEMRTRTETRFIIITHNAVSMSRMDRLFGVTMQERGVSRLVSVDLQAAERLAAA
ncbi:MAG TPA: chromosome segregation protein SMC [Hyphomonadaceae bacterium]|nr:chromosome segregation protein SMC [Hyphomonadaceae bacterium]